MKKNKATRSTLFDLPLPPARVRVRMSVKSLAIRGTVLSRFGNLRRAVLAFLFQGLRRASIYKLDAAAAAQLPPVSRDRPAARKNQRTAEFRAKGYTQISRKVHATLSIIIESDAL